MKTRKFVAVIICLIMVLSLIGCGNNGSDEGTDVDGTVENGDVKEQETDDEIVIALMMKSMASEWNQNIEAALLELGEERGYSVLTFDADNDPQTMLDQMNDAIHQKVDAIFMHIADEGIATACAELAEEAGIPMIGESLPLRGPDGNWLIPCVVLDAAGCGVLAADWAIDNWESTSVDFSDPSKVGVTLVTNTLTENAILRHEAAEQRIKELMPEIPEGNYYVADISAGGDDYIDGGYNQTAAILAAHPEMTSWIVIGVMDDYAKGACRAIEEAGLEDATILVSLGGEQAIPEWEGGTREPWYATVYYSAMDFTEPIVDELLAIINNEKTLEDVFSDNIGEGQKYGTLGISGQSITYENFEEHVK